MTVSDDVARERICIKCGLANDPNDSDAQMVALVEKPEFLSDDPDYLADVLSDVVDGEEYWVHFRCRNEYIGADFRRTSANLRRAFDDGEYDHVLNPSGLKWDKENGKLLGPGEGGETP